MSEARASESFSDAESKASKVLRRVHDIRIGEPEEFRRILRGLRNHLRSTPIVFLSSRVEAAATERFVTRRVAPDSAAACCAIDAVPSSL